MSFIFSQPAPGILPANSVDFSEVETISASRILGNKLGVESTIQELLVSDVSTMLSLGALATQNSVNLATQVSGNLSINNLNSGTGASSGTYWRGDGTWAAVGGLPSQTGNADKMLVTDGTSASWVYPGLGAATDFPTTSVILGRGKPSSITGSGGQNTVLIGGTVGNAITTATDNVIIGAYTTGAALTTGTQNTLVGNNIQNLSTGNYNVAVGNNMYMASGGRTGTVQLGVGGSCFADYQVCIGQSYNVQGSGCVGIGYTAGNGTGDVYVGYAAQGNAANNIAIGNTTNAGSGGSATIVGSGSGKSTSSGANNTVVGKGSFNGASLSTAASNSILGQGSGIALTTGSSHCFVGKDSGASVTTNSNNCLVGAGCGQYMTGGSSVGVGLVALGGQSGTLLSGSFNVGLGYSAGRYISSGQGNLAIGPNAIVGQTGTPVTGSDNVGIGGNSGTYISSGSRNVGVGLQSLNGAAGTPITASGLVALGAYAGKYCSTTSNELFVDCLDRTTYGAQQTGSILYGVMNATASSQTLTTNSAFTATYGLNVSTAGYGLTVKSGSNAKIGVTSAFPGGNPNTITVSTTAVTANSIIFVSAVSFTGGLTGAPYVSAITAGTSFVITSNDNSFNGTVGWMIVERS